VDACPTWCVVLHAEDDHASDRVHVSASMSVPARLLVGGAGSSPPPGLDVEPGGPAGSPETLDRTAQADLAVAVHRRDGARTTWVYAGDGSVQLLELTAESWARLVPALDRALDLART
jgi:hypothetical protein